MEKEGGGHREYELDHSVWYGRGAKRRRVAVKEEDVEKPTVKVKREHAV